MADLNTPPVLKHTQPIPVISGEAMHLAAHLRTIARGEVIPYAELSRLVHTDVQKDGRGWLRTARKIVLREDRLVFEAVRGIGLKRLTDVEMAVIGQTSLRTINRTAKVGILKSRCIENIPALPTAAQLSLYTHLSILGTFYHISTGRAIKRIENVIARAPAELETSTVLGALLAVPAPPARPRPANV